jgi:hypothetical protein
MAAARVADSGPVMTRRFPAVLVIGAALLAGCGGSSKARDQEAKYVAAGNAICAQELTILHQMREPTTPEQAISYLPHAIAIINRQSQRLTALNVPASKRNQLEAAVSSGRQLGALLVGFLRQLKAGKFELATFSQVQTHSNELRSQIDAHFRQAGLAKCVENH